MNYIFSATTNAFYPLSMKDDYVKAGSWPSDGLEVSDEDFNKYSGYAPEGKQLTSNKKGYPVWCDLPPLSKEQLISIAESQRSAKISAAVQSISLLQLKLQMGRILTEQEGDKVSKALDYIDALESLDVRSAPDIDWPTPPQ